MNELILFFNERKIITPYCEITFKLEHNADKECLLESLEYWGVKYRDMNAEHSNAMQWFEQKRKEVKDAS